METLTRNGLIPLILRVKFVGNKARERISKRVFQESKARQFFRKNEHFLKRRYVITQTILEIEHCAKMC